jgi:hypothetical protein
MLPQVGQSHPYRLFESLLTRHYSISNSATAPMSDEIPFGFKGVWQDRPYL